MPSSSENTKIIQAKLAALTVSNGSLSCWTNLILAAIVIFTLSHSFPLSLLFKWFLPLAIIVAVRLVSLYGLQTSTDPLTRLRFTQLYFALIVATGLAWGATCLALYPENANQQMVFFLIIAGLSAGSGPTLAPTLRYYLAFNSIILSCLFTRLVLSTSDHAGTLAAVTFIYFVMTSLVARTQHLSLRNIIELQLQNEQLNDKMSKEIEGRKQTEKELHTVSKLAIAASKAKSEFLANMSHEIRTPMNGIIGYTDMLLEGDVNQDQRESLRTIKSCGESLLGLLNDILDLSKIEADHLDLEEIEFNLENLIYSANEVMLGKIADKQIELLVDIEDIATLVHGDSTRLRQILINLIGNSIKFTEHGHVVTSVKTISEDDNEATIHFDVTDTGIGMTAEQQNVIFNAFQQADGSTTRNYGGTGLGLSISQRLVEAMGGHLEVQSTPHQGTSFFFDLTFRKGEAETVPAPQPIHPDLHNKTAILVDDNVVAAAVTGKMLKRIGLTCTSFQDGQAVYAYHAQHPADLIIIDLLLPDFSAYDLRQQLTAESAQQPLTLALTADMRPNTIEKIRKAGFDGYLPKPTRPACVIEMINTLFNKDIQPPSSSPTAEKEVNTAPNLHLNILMAEDNLINQRLQSRILERMGHTVTLAVNGQEALEYAEQHPYDLILMDMQMPVMGGIESTEKIRLKNIQTPIIALTANAFESDKTSCMEAGMNDFLTKPVKKEELLKKITALFPTRNTNTGEADIPPSSLQVAEPPAP